METVAFELARIEERKAFGILCSDGLRRTARIYPDNPWTDSQNTAASVKADGRTVMGLISKPPFADDLFFFAFRDSANADLLPWRDPENYSETRPVVYSVIQYMPPYLPNEDNPPVFKNRKAAESYAVEEKERYLEDLWEGTELYATGSAREGLIVIYDKSREHDLGWAIEIVELPIGQLTAEEREELI